MNFDESKDGEVGIQMGEGSGSRTNLLEQPAKAELVEDGDDDAPLTLWQSFKKSFFNAAKMDDIGGVGVEDLNEKGLALPLLLLYGSMWLGCLVYFAVTGSLENLTKKYLGLELIVDQSQICKEVPMVSSGTFLADAFGNWETSPDFNYNSSVFAMEFTASQLSNDDYSDLMDSYDSQLKQIGAMASKRDVAWSWMAWSTMNFVDSDSSTRFYSLGNAATIYNLEISTAAIASYRGVCTNTIKKVTKTSKYAKLINGVFTNYGTFKLTYPIQKDPATGGMLISGWDQTKFGPCSDQGYVQNVWSWSSDQNPDFQFNAEFDSQTTATIIALNLGLISKDNLENTRGLYDTEFLNLPDGDFYVDPYRVPMNPIFCLADKYYKIKNYNDSNPAPDICFYPYGRKPLLLYPVTAQVGKDFDGTGPQNCQCTTDKKSKHYFDFNTTECNKPRVLMSYFYNVDGSSNSSNGVISFAVRMQQEVFYRGDTRVAEIAFPAMNSAAYLFGSNVKQSVADDYCPGGAHDQGAGDCLGLCSFDYVTSCTKDSDCTNKQYAVKTDDAAEPADYMSDDGASCIFACSTDQTVMCSKIMSSAPDCPGVAGMGCIQPKYSKSISSYWNTSRYYEVSFDSTAFTNANAVVKKKYVNAGKYDSTKGGCLCKGYPAALAKAAAGGTVSTDDGGGVVTDDYSGGGSTPNRLFQTSVVDDAGGYTAPTTEFNSGVYKTSCCLGVSKCECLKQDGTALYSPTRFSSKCCADSTNCWCADGTSQPSCCPQAYDQVCCPPGQAFDNGTYYATKNFVKNFDTVCPDRKCAALVFTVDSTTGIFNPLNSYNTLQRQLSDQKYMENTYKFIKATQTWMSTGQKQAEQIMCVDTFYNNDSMDSLSSAPPLKLTQDYVECHSTWVTAAQNAIGVAAGSASLYANAAMGIVCVIVFTIYNQVKSQTGGADAKLTPAAKKAEAEVKRKIKAEKAVNQLLGTIAEEYIDVKRSLAGGVSDPGIQAIAKNLKEYRKYYPSKGPSRVGIENLDEELSKERLKEAGWESGGESSDSDNSDSDEDDEQERRAFEGKRVLLQGLSNDSPYNGALGKCIAYEADTDARLFRVTIVAPNHIRGKRVKVRFENLRKPTPEEVAKVKAQGPPGQASLIPGLPLPLPEVQCAQQ